MFHMANLTLVYGLRLLPEGEVTEIGDATLKLASGREAVFDVLGRSGVEHQRGPYTCAVAGPGSADAC